MRNNTQYNSMEVGVPVYIEKVEKRAGYLLLDFPDVKTHQRFLVESGLELEDEKRSMIQIAGIKFDKTHVPREGSYYYLPENILRQTDWARAYQPIDENGTNSNVISFTLNLSGSNTPVNFGRALSKKLVFGKEYNEKKGGNEPEAIKEFDIITGWAKGTELVAMDVGQGNWNEVYFKNGHTLIYDLGASVRYTTRCIKNVIRRSKLMRFLHDEITLSKCTLIISHWDIDHYQAIFEVEDDWLKHLGKVIYMADPPNQTSKRALDKIIQHVSYRNRLEIAPATKAPGKGQSSVLHCIYNNNGISLYKGTKCSNRNKSGLSLSIWTASAVAVLPADHHYDQVHQYVLNKIARNKRIYYVIPHHGGHAGDYKLIQQLGHAAEAILSVGPNKWGHPYHHIRNEIQLKFREFTITEQDGDSTRILV